jgi:hypothetical protein
VHQDREVGGVGDVPVPELALGVVPPVVVLPAGEQRAGVGERGHQPGHWLTAEPGDPDRGGGTAPAAITQVAGHVLPAGPDRAACVIQRVVARPGQRTHARERQFDRGEVSRPGAQAQFAATVAAPAPDVPVGVDSQGGVIRHRIGGDRGDFHPGREPHPHRIGKRAGRAAIAQFALAAQAPGIQAAVGQQRVLRGVRGPHLGHLPGQPHRHRRCPGAEISRPAAEERSPGQDRRGNPRPGHLRWLARRAATGQGDSQRHRTQAQGRGQ